MNTPEFGLTYVNDFDMRQYTDVLIFTRKRMIWSFLIHFFFFIWEVRIDRDVKNNKDGEIQLECMNCVFSILGNQYVVLSFTHVTKVLFFFFFFFLLRTLYFQGRRGVLCRDCFFPDSWITGIIFCQISRKTNP